MSSSVHSFPPPRSGYTLPVFACAGAIAALRQLIDPDDAPTAVTFDLLNPPQPATIPIEQIAPLPDGSVLAVTRSDPGDNLDLTRDTPIWSVVAWGNLDQTEPLVFEGGVGIGRQMATGQAAIYGYAKQLMHHHLNARLPSGKTLRVTVILPEGKALAERTSNAAFGVVEGLSLLGTGGVSQPLSAPGQLETFRVELRHKAKRYDPLVFCLGENGLDLALSLGIEADRRVKTANWLGPLLVEAGSQQVKNILLFGYHGKLIKLAGGIFHTHHHVADSRQEILAAHAAAQGVSAEIVQTLLAEGTVEAGLGGLQTLGKDSVNRVYGAIAAAIDRRASAYIQTHCGQTVTVGSLLFNRQRQILIKSRNGDAMLGQVLVD
ncbi:cobalt-precorrin-5B (C(1))-methyltransferase [filamentous cyanobacterium CCP5]|nr:cobalt-precorrin-5B (C(1))-methyltransferase [filamentous cyanobacterium CCP5]